MPTPALPRLTPQQAAAALRELATSLLGYALALAEQPPLDSEQAAALLAAGLYRQPPPRIDDPLELAAVAESEARLPALLHGNAQLAEQDGVWTQTVSICADRDALERFGVPLERYDRTAALGRGRQRGLARDTRLAGEVLVRRVSLPARTPLPCPAASGQP